MECNFDRVGEIRSPKIIEPKLFDPEIPFTYVWSLDERESGNLQIGAICETADRLYQFGRGVDMAWAWGEVLNDERLEALVSSYAGVVHRPSGGGGGSTLACPQLGSLKSLNDRHRAGSRRFKSEGQGKAARQLFSQPPKPRFAQVAYDSPPSRRTFDLRELSREASFCAWPLARASRLVGLLRDRLVERLRQALPDRSVEIERFVIGRKADGADDAPTSLTSKDPAPAVDRTSSRRSRNPTRAGRGSGGLSASF